MKYEGKILGKWKEVKGRGRYGSGGGEVWEVGVGRDRVETDLFFRCKNGEENWLLTNYIDVIHLPLPLLPTPSPSLPPSIPPARCR